jgi:hypothetical protein
MFLDINLFQGRMLAAAMTAARAETPVVCEEVF